VIDQLKLECGEKDARFVVFNLRSRKRFHGWEFMPFRTHIGGWPRRRDTLGDAPRLVQHAQDFEVRLGAGRAARLGPLLRVAISAQRPASFIHARLKIQRAEVFSPLQHFRSNLNMVLIEQFSRTQGL